MLHLSREFPTGSYENAGLKRQILNWARQSGIFVCLDSNGYNDPYGKYDFLLAAGVEESFSMPAGGTSWTEALTRLHRQRKGWLFGHISYDFKNTIEPGLSSVHPARTGFPDIFFFSPSVVMAVAAGGDSITVSSAGTDPAAIWDAVLSVPPPPVMPLPSVRFAPRTSMQDYIRKVEALREHIAAGDCYEINFCAEHFAAQQDLDPLQAFFALNSLAPAPFAAFYRLNDRYLICGSPERYLNKRGDMLVAQPMKGTRSRHADPEEDRRAAEALRGDIKERAENIMITDLMRNDLARSCRPGSVKVEELFGIYSFPRVHQMISTVTGRLREDAGFAEALEHTFPMGSMTGAPKYRVMQLIDEYEDARRELFSGTVGYISPEGDFDFNVIIRSLFYNRADRYLSFQAGGAITYDSNPLSEWEEMRLKAWSMERIFS